MKTVVLDIDETVAFSRYGVEDMPGAVEVHWKGGIDYTLGRPGNVPFLQELKARGYEIISVTQGVVPWQKEVLKALGIADFFSEIYGWTTLQRTFASKIDLSNTQFVMLDNLSASQLWEKQVWMNVSLEPGKNFIQVKEFRGNPDAGPLSDYLYDIHRMLT